MAGGSGMRCLHFTLAAALVCGAVPAAAQTASVSDAQALLEAGRADEAVEILASLSQAQPDDTDLLRRLAQAQAAAGDLPNALATIDRAVAIAPQDNDLLLARGYILAWSGQTVEARVQYDGIVADAPDYPGLAQLDATISGIESGSERTGVAGLTLAAGISEIEFASGASSTWHNVNLSGFAEIGDIGVVTVSVDREERQLVDTRLSLRLERRVGDGFVFGAVTHTPGADFREQWSVMGGGEFGLSSDISLLFDARYAEYNTNTVFTARPGLRYRITPRLSATGQWINLFQEDGGYKYGASGRFDYALTNGGNLYFGGAAYPDTEAGVTRQVRGVFLGTSQPISRRLTLYAAGEYEERDQSYERIAATIGLGWRFGS